MTKAYWGLLSILVLGLALFGTLSLWPDGVTLGDTRLATATFAQTLLENRTPTRTSVGNTTKGNVSPTPAPDKPKAPVPVDTTSKTILFIGDSMLEGLGPRLAAYAKHNGHTLVNIIWYSSTTEVWGRTDKLKGYINQFKPDYVFVCLGANELFVNNIKAKRQRYLDNMLAQIGSIPYVWIGPPNWKPDTGINDMLEATCAPGCFYLSNGQQFDRSKDGAHPTRASSSAWCDRVCEWVVKQSAHPIRLDRPTEAKAYAKTIVLQPAK